MLEKILLKVISSSNYSWPGHVVQTYNNICQTCKFSDLIVKFRAQQYLPVVHVSRVGLLPKPKEGKITGWGFESGFVEIKYDVVIC